MSKRRPLSERNRCNNGDDFVIEQRPLPPLRKEKRKYLTLYDQFTSTFQLNTALDKRQTKIPGNPFLNSSPTNSSLSDHPIKGSDDEHSLKQWPFVKKTSRSPSPPGSRPPRLTHLSHSMSAPSTPSMHRSARSKNGSCTSATERHRTADSRNYRRSPNSQRRGIYARNSPSCTLYTPSGDRIRIDNSPSYEDFWLSAREDPVHTPRHRRRFTRRAVVRRASGRYRGRSVFLDGADRDWGSPGSSPRASPSPRSVGRRHTWAFSDNISERSSYIDDVGSDPVSTDGEKCI